MHNVRRTIVKIIAAADAVGVCSCMTIKLQNLQIAVFNLARRYKMSKKKPEF